MDAVRGAWGRWADWCGAQEDARPLTWTRIAVCTVVVLDMLRLLQLGLVKVIFVPFEQGGLVGRSTDAWFTDDLLGASMGGPAAFAVTVACMVMGACGILVRPALVIGALAYAQLGHCYPAGDRAIDRLLRTVLLLLAIGGPRAYPTWRLLTAEARERLTTSAWPGRMIRWLLVLVYLSAGSAKVLRQPEWLFPHGRAVLYRILADPLTGSLDPVAAQQWGWLFKLLGQGTIVMELSAPLLLTRLAPVWGLGAVAMHLGIAALMDLGMFSWGMLALYPVVYGPTWLRWAARR